ncbi:MAG TPA: hypothetical protein VNF47_27175 [Streptosporangiaceae bacterium]|nr:hypothetical protein [Streptosporangiaceae bacterium]
MRKQLAKLALAGGVIVTALGVAIPAYASTWTVSGGTSWSATNSTTVTLKDTTHGTSFSCSVAKAAGSMKNGTGLAGSGIGSITSSSFGNSTSKCSGSFGATGTAVQASGSTELINAVSYSSGVTTGTVSNIDTILSVSDLFGTCTATATGTANSTYTNSSGTLAFVGTGPLTIASATGSGCAGVITTGDSVSFSGSYKVTPVLTITSP